jgi:hypothetical protein
MEYVKLTQVFLKASHNKKSKEQHDRQKKAGTDPKPDLGGLQIYNPSPSRNIPCTPFLA